MPEGRDIEGAMDARAGRAAAEVEAAGGMEMGGADLAGALADALAGANVDNFGSYASQDLETMATEEGDVDEGVEAQAQAAAQAAYDDIIGSSTGIAQANIAALGGFQDQSGPPGYEAPGVGTGVEDFAGGNPYAEQQIAANEFADWGAPTPTSTEETQMGMAAPMFGQTAPAQGYQDILGSGAGLAQATQFENQTAAGTPGYAQPGSAWGQGQVEDFTGMPGYGTMATEMSDYAGATMGQGGVSQNIGMINAGTAQDSAGTVSPSGAGMINMGSVAGYDDTMTGAGPYGEMDEGTLDPNAGGVSAPAATPDGTDFFGDDGNVGVATDSPAGTRMTGEEVNIYGKLQIDKSIMDTSAQLDQKAKAAREKYGTFSKEYQSAQRLANAFKSLDAYSKAYSATQGGSFLGSLLSGAMPFASAFKAMQGWLTSKGMYSKEMGQDLLGILEKAQKDGNLNEVLRDINQTGDGGGQEAEMALQEEVSSFIQRYPWAAELDPKYIKYLIDNPAELQDLLGEKEGG